MTEAEVDRVLKRYRRETEGLNKRESRELELCFEHRFSPDEIWAVMNHDFDWKQMRETRLGIESGTIKVVRVPDSLLNESISRAQSSDISRLK